MKVAQDGRRPMIASVPAQPRVALTVAHQPFDLRS